MHLHVSKKVLLIILDGFGLRENKDYNAIANAVMPNWDYYTKKYAFGAIDASATAVGLPPLQFGNSEVGHLNIGAGRIVQQDITRIDEAIANGSFYTNSVFINALKKTTTGNIHILGLLSDGGVHSHINHILALIKLASDDINIKKVWLHIFLDGRDTPPQSATKYIEELQDYIMQFSKVQIATVSGRYYAMDRDKRYDRLQLAYSAIVLGKSTYTAQGILLALTDEYNAQINDEFVRPYVIDGYRGFNNGDSIIFANFRSDRAIQLTDAIISKEFDHFERSPIQLANFVTMTNYDNRFNVAVAFPPNTINNTLGEYIAKLGLHQLRIAETEIYPHITFFFNGGRKEPYQNEERILIDSPRDVATYDLKPQMSLPEVSNKLVDAINSNKYDFIITNFANGDMVGHSGNLAAAIKAVEAVDEALGKVVKAMQDNGGEVLVIADHGNCEEMFDYEAKQPHTQHTTNFVPCLYIGKPAKIIAGGALKDVAPTLLAMSGLEKPQEMTGHSLIEFI